MVYEGGNEFGVSADSVFVRELISLSVPGEVGNDEVMVGKFLSQLHETFVTASEAMEHDDGRFQMGARLPVIYIEVVNANYV